MSLELIQAIGTYIVGPICAAAVSIVFLWKAM